MTQHRERRAPKSWIAAGQLGVAAFAALVGLVIVLALGAIAPTGTSVLQPVPVSAQSVCPQPLGIVNGGFESPDVPGGGYDFVDPAATGWSTTDSNGVIEIWNSGFQGVPAYEGGQFAEINAYSNGTLSQTLDTSTLAGEELTWSFAHRARVGVDSMALLIGAPGNLVQVGTFSAGTGGWVFNQGTYTVPEGQAQTQFAYRAISTGSGSPAAGNFLDAVSFGVPACEPSITLDKSSDYLPGDALVVGDTITYSFSVENTGTIDLTNVRVTDPLEGLSAITPEVIAELPVGETATFSATYVIDQDDVDAGVVQNTAMATADSPQGYTGPPPTATDSEQVPPDQVPALSIVKTSDVEEGQAVTVGDDITYSFVVENTGNVTLTDVTITDNLPGLTWVTGPVVGTLAPGETATGTATYTVTQSDIDLGGITNSATATGTPPPGCVDCPPPVSPPSQEIVPIPRASGLAFEKTADTEGPVDVGDVITYTFTVENTGNVTLNDVTITDTLTGLTWVTGPNVGDLAPGATATGEATYTVTQADVDNGGVTNSATADCAVSCVDEPPTDGIIVPGADPGLTIEKTANPIGGVIAGDTITYTFTVTNTGNVPLDDVTITDTLDGLTWVTGPNLGTLAPGAIATGEATYVVTQEDVDSGGVTNSAMVDCAVSCVPEPPTDGVEVPTDQVPGLSIDKTADTEGPVGEGDEITYTFLVENTGTTTLADVTITDTLTGLNWITGPNLGNLAPGEVVTGEATYTVTADDVAAGGVTNAASVDCAASCVETPPTDEVTIPTEDPGVTITKVADTAGPVSEGDVITYTFTATNTGNTTLENVTVNDQLAGLEWVTGPNLGTIAPGGTATGEATYTVTLDDVLNGGVTNVATVTCDEGCAEVPPVTVTVPGGDPPGPGQLTIDKTADVTGQVHPGDVVTFIFTVTNTGDTEVTNVTVSDPLPGLGPIQGPQGTTLAPGEEAIFVAEYTVTELDADAGIIANTATATGTGVDGASTTDDDTVQLGACDPDGAGSEVTPTPTEDPGTPDVDVDVDVELGDQAADVAQPEDEDDFDAAVDCGSVQPTVEPTEAPNEPEPTRAPGGGNNGGGNNGGGNGGGGNNGGGGGPITRLPTTGQTGDASALAGTTLIVLLLAAVSVVAIGTYGMRNRYRGR